jgi:hypothetical protein
MSSSLAYCSSLRQENGTALSYRLNTPALNKFYTVNHVYNIDKKALTVTRVMEKQLLAASFWLLAFGSGLLARS